MMSLDGLEKLPGLEVPMLGIDVQDTLEIGAYVLYPRYSRFPQLEVHYSVAVYMMLSFSSVKDVATLLSKKQRNKDVENGTKPFWAASSHIGVSSYR